MPVFASGRADPTADSVRQGDSMRRIEAEVGGLAWPASREDVLQAAGDLRVTVQGGRTVPLAEVLRGTHVDEFTSPRHVAEVARLAWALPTDQHPPEGSG